MSSRRTMTRSYSADGRSTHYNGDDVNGSSRPSSRSYLSSVRPESRSTLCSVMAQLTEETQPSFETTLKSKAVSENCNMKFTCVVKGYPTPQVIWYKDDIQLDRYCGLPKYEIFHNGQNHSLHIYNCTVDDAAIYQASASNTKGIVACSGVLEVGEMSEYKIHERYFAKLKQKAVNRRRELEGKENQGPGGHEEQLRTISPERSQRKRRTPMEAGRSTPSSMEDEGVEESHPAPPVETEARLQESAGGLVEDKGGRVEENELPIVNGQVINENGSKGITYIFDSVQKIFTAHEPKTPFIKKKIKISNSVWNSEANTPPERLSEEKTTNDTCIPLASAESLQLKGALEEVMEVDRPMDSSESELNSDSVTKTEQPDRTPNDKVFPINKTPLKGNAKVPTPKEQPTFPVSSAMVSPATLIEPVTGSESKQVSNLQKEVGHRVTERYSELCSPSLPVTAAALQPRPIATAQQLPSSIVKVDSTKTQPEDRVMEVDPEPTSTEPPFQLVKPVIHKALNVTVDLPTDCLHRSHTSIPVPHGTSDHGVPGSADTPGEGNDASPQCLCKETGDKLSDGETSPSLMNVSVSRPPLRGEPLQVCPAVLQELHDAHTGKIQKVAPTHTRTNRDDAPVNIEPLLIQCKMDVQSPPTSPSVSETTTDEGQISTLHNPVQAGSVKISQDTWDPSRGSNESHTVLFTDLQKSCVECPGHGENTRGYNISLSAKQSPDEVAIKTVDGTEIQVDEKAQRKELGRLHILEDNLAPNENKVEMETDSVSLKVTDQDPTQSIIDAGGKEVIDFISAQDNNKSDKNKLVLRGKLETHLKTPNLDLTELETLTPYKNNSEHYSTQNTSDNTEQQIQGFKEIQKPVSKVISVAELMRSQIKALESDNALFSSATDIHISTEKFPELPMDHKETEAEIKNTKLESKMETSTDASPTLISKDKPDDEAIKPLNTASPTAKTSQKSLVIPSTTAIAMCRDSDTRKMSGSTEKENDNVMDIAEECESSIPVSLKDGPDVLRSRTEIVQISSDTSEELSSKTLPSPNLPINIVPENIKTMVNTTKANSPDTIMSALESDACIHSTDLVFTQNVSQETKPFSKLNHRTEPDSATLTDGNTKHNESMRDLKKTQGVDTKGATISDKQVDNNTLIQHDSSLAVVEELSMVDSLILFANNEAIALSKTRNSSAHIPSATPKELASGARPKIFIGKPKTEDRAATSQMDNRPQKEEAPIKNNSLSPTSMTVSPSFSRRTPLIQPSGQQTPPRERQSPLLTRRKMAQETSAQIPEPIQQNHSPKTEEKLDKTKPNPFKAPQVIRKIRWESFSDTSGHLKIWCQFFNVLSDSTLKWYKDEVEIAQLKRSSGDETQVNLAIVQASSRDCGVYGCTITNEHGTDSTDFLLSVDILAAISLREDLGVGEEIEMIPLLLTKGLADCGVWGNKFFGRIMMQESQIGGGCSHKAWRAKVIYGLEPVYESGTTCIIKVRNPITYGGKDESHLIEKNLATTQQECRIQNMAREYCKIFSAESRVIENFGTSLEVIPVYMMYRPAHTIPHATVEVDLKGVYMKYCLLDATGRLVMRTGSEVEHKCCALQHWIHQWTNGNLLLTNLEGVDTKITNVGISVKSTGYQGLPVTGNLKVFEQFVSQHQCNYYCGLLSLKSLKPMDSLQMPSKPKGSRSPLLQRKMVGSPSSPLTSRKSPRMPRKSESDQNSSKASTKQKVANTPKVDEMR